MHICPDTGAATPLLPLTTSPSVRAWLQRLGPVSAGPPPVHIVKHALYLGLGHVKLFRKKGSRRTSTAAMVRAA